MNRFKIGAKLTMAFVVLLLLTTGLGVFAVDRLASVKNVSGEVTAKWMIGARLTLQMNTASSNFRIAETQHLLAQDDEERARFEKEMSAIGAELEQSGKLYGRLIVDAAEKELWDGFQRERVRYLDENMRVLRLSRANEIEDARALLLYNSQKKYEQAASALNKLVEFNIDGGNAASGAAESSYRSALAWIVAALGCAIVLGAVLAWTITRSITVPIRQSVQIAEAVARGDLASEVAVHGADETAQLLNALGRMNQGLAVVVAGVRDSSNRIALSSREIAEGGMDLSHRTEEQAANLQQLVASVEHINSAVQTNAAAAQEAARLASLASAAAGRGSQVMRDVVGTMAEITQASNRIGNITGLIDGIAFQSNILALNAAVEAARAGDAGRGFGVVAGEVRVLAQRSAEAAKDIRRLIEQSVLKVEAGSSRVSDAGNAIVEIASQVDSVNGLINEISTSTTDQTANIAVVHEAIVELDRATQQNAALVEESAAASETLSEYAQSLVDAVAVFKLGQGDEDASGGEAQAAGDAGEPAHEGQRQSAGHLAHHG